MPNSQPPPLNEIIGRDALARQVWQTLEQKSIVLTAERRMGKTYLLYKLWGEAKQKQLDWIQGWECVFQDLSGCSTPIEFVQSVFDRSQDLLSKRKRNGERIIKFLSRFQEIKVGMLQLPKAATTEWKELLTSIFADLSQLPDDRVLFLWDEFPVMLDEIIKRENETQNARDILNHLHTLRAEYPRIRMILTGSIGLHHVLTRLRQDGYNNPVTNDMAVLSVEPLAPEFAFELAESLLLVREVQSSANFPEIAKSIAREVDCIPFYIDRVIEKIRYSTTTIDTDRIRSMVKESLLDADNSWHMGHYLERIGNYYGAANSELVENILDLVAEEEPISTKEIVRIIKAASQASVVPERTIREMLELLTRDHYLQKDSSDLSYRFRYPLIQRYWQYQRG
jgi:AAA+ ATPase superfamily predicted ATPase